MEKIYYAHPAVLEVCVLGDDELEKCIDDCSINPAVRVVVMSGAGVCFFAGGNVKFIKTVVEGGDYDHSIMNKKWGLIIAKIRNMPKPL